MKQTKMKERTPKLDPVESAWQVQLDARKTLMETWDGDFKAFTGSLPQLNTAFYRTEDGLLVPSPKVVCIDEGTTGGIRIAGAGILLGAKETIEMLRELEIQTVHSHDGCGAAALAAKEAGKYLDEPDRYGQEFAAELSAFVSLANLPS
jgi:hypothetical protein